MPPIPSSTPRRGPRPAARAALRVGALALLGAAAAGLSGCFDAPKIEDRWTRIDLESASVTPDQPLPAGAVESVTVNAAITFRSILTGYAVTEVRSSPTIANAAVLLDPSASRVPMATDIDTILAHSVSLGRSAQAVTGWDHLIERMRFPFAIDVPAAMDSAGGTRGLFLLCYLGTGDKIERRDGSDTIVVTPMGSARYEILPIGMKLTVGSPGAAQR